jgi:hypothetical protein
MAPIMNGKPKLEQGLRESDVDTVLDKRHQLPILSPVSTLKSLHNGILQEMAHLPQTKCQQVQQRKSGGNALKVLIMNGIPRLGQGLGDTDVNAVLDKRHQLPTPLPVSILKSLKSGIPKKTVHAPQIRWQLAQMRKFTGVA